MRKKRPEISVIIPAFKAKKTIFRAVNSVKNQNINQDQLEIIISVDDNNSYYDCKQIWQNTKIIHFKNKVKSGAGQARNRGINLAQGKLIGFLDADDTWSIDYINELKGIAYRYGVAFGSTEILSKSGKHLLLLKPKNKLEIKHFGIFPGSFHPLVIKRFAGPFPDGPSQDIIHAINILRKVNYRNKTSIFSKYQLWLNDSSHTSEKNFSYRVESSYKKWREYYKIKEHINDLKIYNETIKVMEKRRNWNRLFLRQGQGKIFYEFLSEKLKMGN